MVTKATHKVASGEITDRSYRVDQSLLNTLAKAGTFSIEDQQNLIQGLKGGKLSEAKKTILTKILSSEAVNNLAKAEEACIKHLPSLIFGLLVGPKLTGDTQEGQEHVIKYLLHHDPKNKERILVNPAEALRSQLQKASSPLLKSWEA